MCTVLEAGVEIVRSFAMVEGPQHHLCIWWPWGLSVYYARGRCLMEILCCVPTSRETTVSDGPVGVQELLSSLPVSTMPSFMQSLVSSLSHLTTQASQYMT